VASRPPAGAGRQAAAAQGPAELVAFAAKDLAATSTRRL